MNDDEIVKNISENLVRGVPLFKGLWLSVIAALMVVVTVYPMMYETGAFYTMCLGVSAIAWFSGFVLVERMLVDTWNELQIVQAMCRNDLIEAVLNKLDDEGTSSPE